MKATELRIGNYLMDCGELLMDCGDLVKVKGVFGDGRYYPYQIECEDKHEAPTRSDVEEFAEPIPLTEEWLLKMGFKAYRHALGVNYKNKQSVRFKNKNGFFSIYNVELKHVHQLQNLYFALTGEELTID